MTDISFASQAPILSPAFDKARRLSRILARVFAVFFWLVLVYLALASLLMAVAPVGVTLDWQDVMLPLAGHSAGEHLLGAFSLALGVLPGLFLLRHAQRLFGCFARGEVFADRPVAHIRAAGFWLVVSAIAAMIAKIGLNSASGTHANIELDIQSLVFGAATFVAAHVMAEARRIADDNAGIL